MRRCMRGDRRMKGMHWMRDNIIHLRWRLWLWRRISMRVRTCRSLMVKRSGQGSIGRVHVVAAGRERRLGRRLWLRLCHNARAIAVDGQGLAGPGARLVPVERRARRGAGTARVKRRGSVESAAAMAPDPTAAQVYRQCLLLVVTGARTAACSTWGRHRRRPLHRAAGVTERRRQRDSRVRVVVVMVVMLEVVAMLLEAAGMWVSQCMMSL